MFSDSRAAPPGEQKGFKPHTPHFLPWLRNSLKSHQSSDLGLSKPHKSNPEAPNNLTPLEKSKGIGFFSFTGKDRGKKSDFRCNGVAMAKMLPVVLKGPHIMPGNLGKQREDSPRRWNQSPELVPDPNTHINPGEEPRGLVDSSTSAEDNHTPVRNQNSHLSVLHSQKDRTSTTVRKYGPLVTPVALPASFSEVPDSKLPLVVCMQDRRGKVWDYTNCTTFRQRDLHSSSWASPETQGLIERQQEFSSSISYFKQQSRNSHSHRDLTALGRPPVEAHNGVIFSTEVPQRGPGCVATLRRPRKPRPSSEHIAVPGQSQMLFEHRANSEGAPQRKEAGCSRKAVRNQIKRVMDNLEQVLTALRDVHQEMKEVVQQIDHLTSSIDLNEDRGGDDARPPGDSSSSRARLGSIQQSPSHAERWPGTADSWSTLGRVCRTPGVQLCPVSSGPPSERGQTFRFTCGVGFSPRKGGLLPNCNDLSSSGPSHLQNPTSVELSLPSPKTLPVRPPTPGLSPLTVNLHPPISPVSQPDSPDLSSSTVLSPVSPPSPLSSKPHPPPAFSPSVIVESREASYQTSQGDRRSADLLSASSYQPPSASGPPTDSEMQSVTKVNPELEASSAGHFHSPSRLCGVPAAAARAPATRGRRGRKPPPYPHHSLSERTKKATETRKAPPYPEKRKLLSTTV